jgi:hypothetical protein
MRRRFLGCLFSSIVLSVAAGAANDAARDERKDMA